MARALFVKLCITEREFTQAQTALVALTHEEFLQALAARAAEL
jgi:hypothetical protein